MLDKIYETMDFLYEEAKQNAARYRKLDAEVADVYFEFSHELYGVTTLAVHVCTGYEPSKALDRATDLRNKFWEEEVRGVQ